jgi:putative transposase
MNTYKRRRFPPDIISCAVWLYYRFNPSHRDIEDLLAERGITVSYETVRPWRIKFGAKYANNRAEQSDEATRVRERGMRKFKSMVQAQRFVTAHAATQILFNLGWHLASAEHYRDLRVSAFNERSRAVA